MTARRNYNERVARRICALIAEGESLGTIAKMPGMPPRRSIRDWLSEHGDFERKYEIAHRQRTDALVDEAIEIADSVRGTDNNAAVQAARLAVDTRRWLASKLLPERFGDRLEHVGVGGKELLPAQTDTSKIALVLLGILNRARPERDDEPGDELAALEPAPAPRPLLTLPEEPEAADVVSEAAPPPLPGPQWTRDATGQTRHVSELGGLRVVK